MTEQDDKLQDINYLETSLYNAVRARVIKALAFLSIEDQVRLLKELEPTTLRIKR